MGYMLERLGEEFVIDLKEGKLLGLLVMGTSG
jgi:hypothetical protein